LPATQERYYEMLMERVRTDRYPSHQLLDRIEASFWTPEQIHEYVEMLIDKADESWYTSDQLLDRIQRLLAVAAASS
jgi:aspartyl-tRNA synthetase